MLALVLCAVPRPFGGEGSVHTTSTGARGEKVLSVYVKRRTMRERLYRAFVLLVNRIVIIITEQTRDACHSNRGVPKEQSSLK